MEETKNDPRTITVLGIYFIDKYGKRKIWFPLSIDRKIWKAIEKVNNFNNNFPDSDQQSIAQTGNYSFHITLTKRLKFI